MSEQESAVADLIRTMSTDYPRSLPSKIRPSAFGEVVTLATAMLLPGYDLDVAMLGALGRLRDQRPELFQREKKKIFPL